MASARSNGEETPGFEELTRLEAQFDQTDLELTRRAAVLNGPLYEARAAVTEKIPYFWATVFEQAPFEFESWVQPSDSMVFAEALSKLNVQRFEIDEPEGSPRSFVLRFTFAPNIYFEDAVLEKRFWYRRSLDGWAGLVSEPVKIHWKEGKDLTGGLTDAAVALFEARTKLHATANGDTKAPEKELPEYKALTQKMEESEDSSLSFFTFFGYVSNHRWVTAEESQQAHQAVKTRLDNLSNGKKPSSDEAIDEDDDEDWQETEVFPQSEEIATIIADDMWPSAIKYFKNAHEIVDEDEEGEASHAYESSSDEDGPVDIRALVGKGRKSNAASNSPPPPKQRKLNQDRRVS